MLGTCACGLVHAGRRLVGVGRAEMRNARKAAYPAGENITRTGRLVGPIGKATKGRETPREEVAKRATRARWRGEQNSPQAGEARNSTQERFKWQLVK